jgi:hypothetical protein
MTHKYEKKCWSCGSTDIETDGRGIRCKSCRATWNQIPNLGGATRLSEEFHDVNETYRNTQLSGSPSRCVVHQATRARGEITPKRRPKL